MANCIGYIELDEDCVEGMEYGEYEVQIEYSATPYVPAYTAGPPEKWSPAEGGEIEIESAILPDGRDLLDVYKGCPEKLEDDLIYWVEKGMEN